MSSDYRCNGESIGQFGCESDRVSQTVNGVTTNYVLDSASDLTQVLQDGTNTYIYGVDRIAQMNSAAPEYFLTDGLGSVRQLVDNNGAIILAKNYDPYGTETGFVGSSATSYGFTGEMVDSTGLLYLRARYYESGMGRFITRDTWEGDINSPMSFNRWMYGYGNPVKYTDPSGHYPPEHCVYDPSQNIGFIEKNAGGFLSKNNWLDTYTAAGIAVQCWAQSYDWKANDEYDGLGPAKITDAQASTIWGWEIKDYKEDIRGYGLLCYIVRVSIPQGTVMPCTVCEDEDYMKQHYGVGNYQLEDPHDQTQWKWAVEYMRRTIKLITDVCERERNCLGTDKFIAAALGQNGPGFNKVNMKNKSEVRKLSDPTPNYRLDWGNFFLRDNSRMKVNTQIQLSRFNTAILALEGKGWFVPDRDKDYINWLIAGGYK